jgi:two-component system chemotaxis sensor kinase CheA
MPRARVEQSLLQAFREEFHQDLALVREQWEAYKPTRKTKLSDLAELRRVLHTVKGSTRLLGFSGVPEQVHRLEEMVLEALRKKKKPEEFWDALSDLETSVGRLLGEDEVSTEMEAVQAGPWTGGASVSLSESVSAPTSSPAYSFLLSVDELLMLSERLAEQLQPGSEEATSGAGVPRHQADLLVQRAWALREEARRMTLVPSSELFVGMTELARRTADDRGKTVRVIQQVAPDQLERATVLGLRPALLHLVANAVSHGIEGESGELIFGYRRQATSLEVWVGDRGPGLDTEALEKAVVGGGHMTRTAWQASSREEQLSWLFHPGLSTRSEADLTAGRGMGLSVVAETAERLGGRVVVESSPRGTEFRLLIPAGWNLRTVLKVRSGKQRLAVISSELAGVEATALGQSSGSLAGELAQLLGYPSESGRASPYRLLLNREQATSLAVGVDQLGDFEEILVTPLLGFHGLSPAVIGVTLHHGDPIPVVSLRSLAQAPQTRPLAERMETLPPPDGPLLLVVDDSLTTRSLVTGILRSSGYRVLVAADGEEGLNLARSTPELEGIVSDLQMPVLDGLGFLEALRADPETAALPFVLLTSIDDVATFEKASALGADRCLGKQNFTQELLLKILEELL